MTYREKLEQEHPESINSNYGGGCAGCPCNYGYEAPVEKDCPTVSCTDCWDREMTCNEEKGFTLIIQRRTDILESKEYWEESEKRVADQIEAKRQGVFIPECFEVTRWYREDDEGEYQKLYNQLMEVEKDAQREIERLKEENFHIREVVQMLQEKNERLKKLS